MRLPKEARQNVKSLEEGVLGGDLAQVTDLSAEPLALLGPFGQQLFKVPQRDTAGEERIIFRAPDADDWPAPAFPLSSGCPGWR
jgi:hypothetical protein